MRGRFELDALTPIHNHGSDGLLWGKYRTLSKAEPYDLITNMVVDRQGRVQFFPALSRAEWRAAIVARDLTGRSPAQENARKAGQTRAERARASRAADDG